MVLFWGANSTLDNQGTINISGTQSYGVLLKGGLIINRGTITVSGAGSKEEHSINSTPTTKKVGQLLLMHSRSSYCNNLQQVE